MASPGEMTEAMHRGAVQREAVESAGTVAARGTGISASESWTIDLARIVCVYFMIWVHVYPATREASYVFEGPAHILWFVIIDVMGRASVATLSFFSGYVLFLQSASRPARTIIAERFRSIYVPMVTWGLLAFAAVWVGTTLVARTGETMAQFFQLDSAWDLVSLILAIDRQPANQPIGFLRDLFVTIVLLTLLRPLAARWGLLLLALFLPLAAFDATWPVILRPSIALFALAGFVCAAHGWTLSTLATPRIALPVIGVLLLAFVLSLVLPIPSAVLAEEAPNLTKRALLVMLMLVAGAALARHWSHLPVARMRTVMFVTFLSHGIVTEILGLAYTGLGGSLLSPVYLIFFFAVPPILLAVGAVGTAIIARLPGWAQLLLRGASLKQGRRQPA